MRGNAHHQHAVRAETIDEHAGYDLANAGSGVEDRYHPAELKEADAEVVPDEREDRRKRHLQKVAAEMCRRDRPDRQSVETLMGLGHGFAQPP